MVMEFRTVSLQIILLHMITSLALVRRPYHNQLHYLLFSGYHHFNYDELVKSPLIVMPDLIRHPEHIDFTGFRRSPE